MTELRVRHGLLDLAADVFGADGGPGGTGPGDGGVGDVGITERLQRDDGVVVVVVLSEAFDLLPLLLQLAVLLVDLPLLVELLLLLLVVALPEDGERGGDE